MRLINKIEFDLDFEEMVELLLGFINQRTYESTITFQQVNKPDFDELDKEEFFIFMLNMLKCEIELLQYAPEPVDLTDILYKTDLTSCKDVEHCLRLFWVRYGEWSCNTGYEWR